LDFENNLRKCVELLSYLWNNNPKEIANHSNKMLGRILSSSVLSGNSKRGQPF
jgi:hypothetical protein